MGKSVYNIMFAKERYSELNYWIDTYCAGDKVNILRYFSRETIQITTCKVQI